MSREAINIRNKNQNANITSIFNCEIHGEIRSIHKRCPKCYLDRMKNYSHVIRNRNRENRRRNSLNVINRSNIIQSESNYKPHFVPSIRNNRIFSEPINRVRRNSFTNRLRLSPFLPQILLHPPLPSIPSENNSNQTFNNNLNIDDMIRIQSLLNENDIRNYSLRDIQETSEFRSFK